LTFAAALSALAASRQASRAARQARARLEHFAAKARRDFMQAGALTMARHSDGSWHLPDLLDKADRSSTG
jgi:hypothetical protein